MLSAMTQRGATVSMRPARPSSQPWTPREFSLRAVDHLTLNMKAGLALDPGLGKTAISLAAFLALQSSGTARSMLVIAPLRVCRTVWRQEGAKWSEFRHLKFSLLHGSKKRERLVDDADIWMINPEGVAWLCKQYAGRQLPFDVVCIDELTKFKNQSSERSKLLRPRIERTPRIWGLTGSLAPNGYSDVFGQQLILDGGAALGRFVTHFREQYFQLDYNGLDYTLMPGAEQRIISRIAPYWMQLSADDYLQLPQLVVTEGRPGLIHELTLEPAERRLYEKMRKDMLAELPAGTVTAANAAACYSKLAQMANGAVYVNDKRDVAHIHDVKLDALEEIVEELNGQPLLLAYEFQHDLERLRERFGANLPYLGNGTTAKQEEEWIGKWNRNELALLACHPASAGHGLNLQEGNAAHIAWLSPIWDLELWDQFISRVRRSGNQAQRIFNHVLVVKDSIDELKLDALADKDVTQTRLLRALNQEIRRDAEAQADGETLARNERIQNMAITRLGAAPNGAAPPPAVGQINQLTQPQPGNPGIRPAGWPPDMTVGKVQQRMPTPEAEQRERIQQQLTGTQMQQRVAEGVAELMAPLNTAFSESIQQAATQLMAVAEAPKATRTRKAKEEPKAEPSPFAPSDAVVNARIDILKLVFVSDGSPSLEEGLEMARLMQEFVEG